MNVNSVPEVRILSAPPKRSLRRRCRLFFDKMGRIRTEGGSTEREPSAKRDVSSLLRHIAVNYAALQSLAFSEAIAYAPLLLLFPARSALLGSQGPVFCLHLFCMNDTKRSLRRRCRLFFDKMGRIRTEGGSTEREPSAKRDVSSLLRRAAASSAVSRPSLCEGFFVLR